MENSAGTPIIEMTALELVSELYNLRLQLKILESAEKSIMERLKPLVDPQFSFVEEKTVGILFGELMLTRTQAAKATLDKSELLVHGVSQDLINLCTKVTPYFTYKVTAKEVTK